MGYFSTNKTTLNQLVMASDDNFPPIKGTYNGINYYLQDGVQRQRKAGGGFTSESIKNNPNMQGIRDSNQELGFCSKFNKCFKEALFPFLNDLEDGTLHRRLMKLFLSIKELDESPFGKRRVGKGLSCESGRMLLQEFKFTPGPSVSEILGPTPDFDSTSGRLRALAFNPKRLKFPKGSTHFSLEYGVLEYNLKQNSFRFTLNVVAVMVSQKDDAQELIVEVAEKPVRGNEVFGVVKVQFYEMLSEQFYKSFAKRGIGIGIVSGV